MERPYTYTRTTHLMHILNHLYDNKNVPQIPIQPEHKTAIIEVFNEISEAFNHCCPPARKNFLNYYFVLRKICILLGFNQYLVLFPIPFKNNKNIMEHEAIWKKICVYNHDRWINHPGFNLL